MAKLDVLKFPDPRLRHKGQPVNNVTDELKKLADDMLETMYAEKGIGLAAIQVGIDVRLLVIDTRPGDEGSASEVDSAGGRESVVAEGAAASAAPSTSMESGSTVSAGLNEKSGNSHKGSDPDVVDEMVDAKERYDLSDEPTELEKAVAQPIVIFNPDIVEKQGKTTFQEGCLSVPGYFETVQRFKYIEVEGLDREGLPLSLKLDGLLSICMQHEIDHLDGKVFIDRLSPIKSKRLKAKIKKLGYPEKKDA